jgi:hypothetical protein
MSAYDKEKNSMSADIKQIKTSMQSLEKELKDLPKIIQEVKKVEKLKVDHS